mmetsp:Transcript_33082/g.64488  ORF Transcript_33082/g.64488 Transcript_33082/m.64488 type:complete len:555 (+) Transcript_33082:39-1703(+)
MDMDVALLPIWTMKGGRELSEGLDDFPLFYQAVRRGTSKCTFFGFGVGKHEFVSRESYENAEGVIAHIKDVYGIIGNALEVCNVDLHFSGPAQELQKIQDVESKNLKPTYWATAANGFFKRENFRPGPDKHLAIFTFLTLKEGKMDEFKKNAKTYMNMTKDGKAPALYAQFAYREEEIRCLIREGFEDADALLDHRDEIDDVMATLLDLTLKHQVRVIAPKIELDKLRGIFNDSDASFLVLDAGAMQLPTQSPCSDVTIDLKNKPKKIKTKSKKYDTLKPSFSKLRSRSPKNGTLKSGTLKSTIETPWIQFIDEETRAPYWFNGMTGETTWEAPENFVTDESARLYSSRRGSILSVSRMSTASQDPVRANLEALDDNPTVRRLRKEKEALAKRLEEAQKELNETRKGNETLPKIHDNQELANPLEEAHKDSNETRNASETLAKTEENQDDQHVREGRTHVDEPESNESSGAVEEKATIKKLLEEMEERNRALQALHKEEARKRQEAEDKLKDLEDATGATGAPVPNMNVGRGYGSCWYPLLSTLFSRSTGGNKS